MFGSVSHFLPLISKYMPLHPTTSPYPQWITASFLAFLSPGGGLAKNGTSGMVVGMTFVSQAIWYVLVTLFIIRPEAVRISLDA